MRLTAGHDMWQWGAGTLSVPNGCHRLVGLNSVPVTNRDPSFRTRTSRNLTDMPEIFSTLIFVVFTSVLHAPNKVFGVVSVSCNNDDVVFEPSVKVESECTQGGPVSSTIAQPRK